MVTDEIIERVRKKYLTLSTLLDERSKRIWAATEAKSLGRGGLLIACMATGMSHNTVRKGQKEIEEQEAGKEFPIGRIRKQGGGRKRLGHNDAQLIPLLEELVESTTRGDPMSPLSWTTKSTYNLSEELTEMGHEISPRTVSKLLKEKGYSLQSNRKTREGNGHPDRNEQFEHINRTAKRFMRRREPVLSIDTKKKELVGNFANKGSEWHAKKHPPQVKVHDFMDKEKGKAIPFGVYDVQSNEGWVSVGIDHDTAKFAAEAVWRWWLNLGKEKYGKSKRIFIMADGGGSNGSRSRLWKLALQELAARLGKTIVMSHFPPGTSKWNKIEHRMFSYITMNWRGRPLISHEVIINLIANTTTKTGLKIKAELDAGVYPTGEKVSDEEYSRIKIKKANFHGDWNYSISP